MVSVFFFFFKCLARTGDVACDVTDNSYGDPGEEKAATRPGVGGQSGRIRRAMDAGAVRDTPSIHVGDDRPHEKPLVA